MNILGSLLRGQKLRRSVVAVILLLVSVITNAADSESVPGEYLVKMKETSGAMKLKSSQQDLSAHLGAHIKNHIKTGNLVVVQRASMETTVSAIASLKQSPLVEYVEPNYIYHISKKPTQGDYPLLWGLHNIGQRDKDGTVGKEGVDIDAESAWDITTGTDEVLVAVIDTGIDYTHSDLVRNAWTNPGETGFDSNGKDKSKNGIDDDGNGYIDDLHGYNFSDPKKKNRDPMDDNGHGTHCSGTIGGNSKGYQGIIGVNWNVKIAGVKAFDDSGNGTTEDSILAIDYAIKIGAKVMSASWGGGDFSQAQQEAIERANKAGVIFIAAAGNEGSDNDKKPTYPANYPVDNIVSVAAIDNQGNMAYFSSYGAKTVHIAAPGVNIFSSVLLGHHEAWSGTSMATPHVSGVAALLASHEPNLTNLQIKQRLISTARALKGLSGQVSSGGMVNAYNALTKNTAEANLQ